MEIPPDNDAHTLPGPGKSSSMYVFTPEEQRVVQECNRESFYQRCVPISTALGVATYYGVNSGYLKRNVKYGAVPKVLIAVAVGYFAGKISYQSKCAEKLMQLPNSPVGEMLRQKRRTGYQESLEPGFGPGMSLPPFSGINPGDTYSDLEPNNKVDIDTTRPQMDGLDDSHRPTVDNPIYEEEMPPVQKHSTTYEELRKKNREEHQLKRTTVYRELGEAPPVVRTSEKSEPGTVPIRTNRYGDTWG